MPNFGEAVLRRSAFSGRLLPDHFARPEFVASFLEELVEDSWRIEQDIACPGQPVALQGWIRRCRANPVGFLPTTGGMNMRIVGIDIYRSFAQVSILKKGQITKELPGRPHPRPLDRVRQSNLPVLGSPHARVANDRKGLRGTLALEGPLRLGLPKPRHQPCLSGTVCGGGLAWPLHRW
jgi:hypothetical protein